jgi:hypothetical protein
MEKNSITHWFTCADLSQFMFYLECVLQFPVYKKSSVLVTGIFRILPTTFAPISFTCPLLLELSTWALSFWFTVRWSPSPASSVVSPGAWALSFWFIVGSLPSPSSAVATPGPWTLTFWYEVDSFPFLVSSVASPGPCVSPFRSAVVAIFSSSFCSYP